MRRALSKMVPQILRWSVCSSFRRSKLFFGSFSLRRLLSEVLHHRDSEFEKKTISSLRVEVSELRETLDRIGSSATNVNHQHSSSANDKSAPRSVKSGVHGGRGRGGRRRGVR